MQQYRRKGWVRRKPTLNFETVLGEMIALSHWMTPAPFGDPLRQIACDGAAPQSLTFRSQTVSFDSFEPIMDEPVPGAVDSRGLYGAQVELHDQWTYLVKALAAHFRCLSAHFDALQDTFGRYRELLHGLSEAFEIGVYNLNYDTLAELALPNAFTGFNSSGNFLPMEVHHLRRNWHFLYHLHGSVHYSLFPPFGHGPIVWRPDLHGPFNDGHSGIAGDQRSDGKSFPTTTLVAGGLKLDQLLVEPFHSFQSALVRHVYEAEAILTGGYGFGDEHVNRALRNRLATWSLNCPPVMVLDRPADGTERTLLRDDTWSIELARTLRAPSNLFREPGNEQFALPPRELSANGGFETANGLGVAVWHGGFGEATSKLPAIVEWLSSGNDYALSRNL